MRRYHVSTELKKKKVEKWRRHGIVKKKKKSADET